MANLAIDTNIEVTGDPTKVNRNFILRPFVGNKGRIYDIAYSSEGKDIVHQYGIRLESGFTLFLFPSELKET